MCTSPCFENLLKSKQKCTRQLLIKQKYKDAAVNKNLAHTVIPLSAVCFFDLSLHKF